MNGKGNLEWLVSDNAQCWKELQEIWTSLELRIQLMHQSWMLEPRSELKEVVAIYKGGTIDCEISFETLPELDGEMAVSWLDGSTRTEAFGYTTGDAMDRWQVTVEGRPNPNWLGSTRLLMANS